MAQSKTKDTSDTAQDVTPDEMRLPLMKAALEHVAFDGWSKATMGRAAEDCGVSSGFAELAFPGGPEEMLALHLQMVDEVMMAELATLDLPSMKIRERITTAVRVRLQQNKDQREIVRRGMSYMLLPPHAGLGAKALWRTCDQMWRAAGDTATDYNWYTKRMMLAAVYMSTLQIWLDDSSDDLADTWEFLDRRIENVMQIEKAKFQFRKVKEKMPSLSRFLGRLRYPVK